MCYVIEHLDQTDKKCEQLEIRYYTFDLYIRIINFSHIVHFTQKYAV